MSEVKPKEFWLREEYKNEKYEFFSCEIATRKPNLEEHNESDFKDSLHVIEYSAYEKLKAQLEKCEAILKDLTLEHKSEEELVENTKLTSESGGGNEDDCFMLGYLQADACTALRAREYFKEKELV